MIRYLDVEQRYANQQDIDVDEWDLKTQGVTLDEEASVEDVHADEETDTEDHDLVADLALPDESIDAPQADVVEEPRADVIDEPQADVIEEPYEAETSDELELLDESSLEKETGDDNFASEDSNQITLDDISSNEIFNTTPPVLGLYAESDADDGVIEADSISFSVIGCVVDCNSHSARQCAHLGFGSDSRGL